MFYGWRVVAGTFVSQLFVVGFFTYAVSLLVPPVREEFGVSLEQVMYSLSAATFLGLFVSPVGGVMMDRLSIRWLMAAGAAFFGAGLLLLASVQSIGAYIAVFALTMSVANILAGSMCSSTVISRWFTVSRGRALGIGAVGLSVGGILIPRLLGYWIEESGWRAALQSLAYAVLLLMLPAVIVLVRGKPEDVGLSPEGMGEGAPSAVPAESLSLGEILRRPAYWYLGLGLGLLFGTYSATMSNITPYVLAAGHEMGDAATFLMVIAGVGLLGKLVFGVAADKMNLKLALGVAQCCVISGYLLLASNPSFTLMLAAATLLGLSAGGMLPVWGALMARIFGLLSYGRAMGLMGPLITICVLPGYTIVGRVYDQTGGFGPVFALFAGVMVVSILLIVPIRLDER
ncbi:MAG: MFS transporter [Pseudomonadota bacterium]